MEEIKKEFGEMLDARRILADLIHDGITSKEAQVESLFHALYERYGATSDDEDLRATAELYRAINIVEAEFLARSEDEDARDYAASVAYDYHTAQRGW